VTTRFGVVQLKVAILPSGDERAVPEFESVHEVALRSGATHQEVASEAVWTYHKGETGS
jgi:uncharacterized protein (DUF111 family)